MNNGLLSIVNNEQNGEKFHLTREEHNILVVSEDQYIIDEIKDALGDKNYNIDSSQAVIGAKDRIQTDFYHIVIIPILSKNDPGHDFLKSLKAESPDTQPLVLREHQNVALEDQLAEDGTYTFHDIPIEPARFRLDIANAIRNIHTYRDGTTGLYTSNILKERLSMEVERLRRMKEHYELHPEEGIKDPCFSVLMMDFDDFKHINDCYGHIDGGDRVLRAAAQKTMKLTRINDTVARFGGDEFVAVVPGSNYDQSLEKAMQICHSIETMQITSSGGTVIPATVTIGVATLPEEGIEFTTNGILHAADKALYYLKKKGKNQVIGYLDVPDKYR